MVSHMQCGSVSAVFHCGMEIAAKELSILSAVAIAKGLSGTDASS